VREILFYSWSTPALKGRSKNTFYNAIIIVYCVLYEAAYIQYLRQHQLKMGDPCLQQINTSLKGEILTSSKGEILVYSWLTPALKGISMYRYTAGRHQL
jgi:hypothetical protein